MKLRNKKTGEIGNLLPWVDYETKKEMSHFAVMLDNREEPLSYNSLAELNEEWEDYEEPKEYWAIDQFGEPINVTGLSSLQLEKLRRIGNLFESEEKTERAAEKLKAWERLKDKEFKFKDWEVKNGCKIFFGLDDKSFNAGWLDENIVKDLDLLFGGEE